MFCHSIISSLMFIYFGFLYTLFKSYNIYSISGDTNLFNIKLIIILINNSFPLTIGFFSEILIIYEFLKIYSLNTFKIIFLLSCFLLIIFFYKLYNNKSINNKNKISAKIPKYITTYFYLYIFMNFILFLSFYL